MRKVIYLFAGLLALVIAAAVALPFVVDVNDYKAEIVAQVRQQTGRALAIDGPIRLSVLPSPVLTAEGVRFANAAGSSESDMVRIRSLRISVSVLPLLSGRLDVTQISLAGARIVLETMADGRANWDFAANGANGRGAERPPVASGDSSSRDKIAVRNLAIEDGTLIWRDAGSERVLQLDKLNARVMADTLRGPFDARLSFEVRDVPLSAEIRAGDLSSDSQPAYFLVKTDGGQISFDGTAGGLPSAPALKGNLRGEGASLAAFVRALTVAAGQSPMALPPAFAQKFQFNSTITGDARKIAAAGVTLSLGTESGSGDIVLQPGPPLRTDVKFSFAKLDFDQLLASRDQGMPAPGAASPERSGAPAGSDTSARALNDIEGSVDLSIGTIVYQGRSARQVAVKADLSRGVLSLHSFGGQFPGNTTIAAAGTVDASKAQPSGDGKVEVKSARVREFLSWLDVDVARVPADRLNALDFTGQITAAADGSVRIANAVAQIDATTARGSVTLRTSPRLGIVADLDIDSVNVDAYLPKEESGAAGKGAAKPSSGGAPAIDATIKARVARLSYRGTQIEGVNADVTVAGDKLTFRPSRVASLAGASIAWNGAISDYDGNPAIDLTLDLQTQDAERLLKLAGVSSPTKQRLGAIKASGRIAGRPNDLTFNGFAVEALGSNIRLTGKFSDGAKGPAYNFSRLELRSGDADRLMEVLGVDSPFEGRKLGALTVSGAAQGNGEQATIDLDVAAQGATFDLKGTISRFRTSPTVALDVGVRHPDFQRFVRLLLPGYGGGAGVGAISFTARVDGSPDRELKITRLHGNLGQAPISGAITANLAGPIPDVAVTLETGGVLEIDRILPVGQRADVEPYLRDYPPNVVPASGGKQVAQAAARGGRFARTPIDVSGLRSVNARIDLKSQALSLPPWRVENAVGRIDLRGGVLTLTQLVGRAFDGDFVLSAVLDAAKLPAVLTANVEAGQVDMGRLSRALSQKDRFDGRMNLTLEISGRGTSEADIVSSLAGKGALGGKIRLNASFAETAGGLLAGQAARQLDKLLGNLTGSKGAGIGGGDLNAAINVVLARFANRDGDASGTLSIRNGVVTSTDLRVTGNRARAETRMTANLPAWTLDATTNVLLDENPRQPYLIVTNRGLLDDPSLSISRGEARASDEPAQQQPSQPQQKPGQLQQDPQQPQPKAKKPSFKDLLKKF